MQWLVHSILRLADTPLVTNRPIISNLAKHLFHNTEDAFINLFKIFNSEYLPSSQLQNFL
jgi:hypothetical protein